jgi:hypothetical protein
MQKYNTNLLRSAVSFSIKRQFRIDLSKILATRIKMKKIQTERKEKQSTYSPNLLIKILKILRLKKSKSKMIAKSIMIAIISAPAKKTLRIVRAKIIVTTRNPQITKVEMIRIFL